MSAYYSNAYLETQVGTSDPIALVISLYESAIAKVSRAMQAIEDGDYVKRGEMTSETAEILLTLSNSLDFSQSNNLAGRLFALYNFMMRQLLEANRNNDVEVLQEVKSTLNILLSGWTTIEDKSEDDSDGKKEEASRISFQMMA
ncbi:MAG: flagellar export chaperone FliS [Candidatus Sumerlaeia bacterium]